jgi:hypothetical protein
MDAVRDGHEPPSCAHCGQFTVTLKTLAAAIDAVFSKWGSHEYLCHDNMALYVLEHLQSAGIQRTGEDTI